MSLGFKSVGSHRVCVSVFAWEGVGEMGGGHGFL